MIDKELILSFSVFLSTLLIGEAYRFFVYKFFCLKKYLRKKTICVHLEGWKTEFARAFEHGGIIFLSGRKEKLQKIKEDILSRKLFEKELKQIKLLTTLSYIIIPVFTFFLIFIGKVKMKMVLFILGFLLIGEFVVGAFLYALKKDFQLADRKLKQMTIKIYEEQLKGKLILKVEVS